MHLTSATPELLPLIDTTKYRDAYARMADRET